MYCSKCGAVVAEGASFCPACGLPTGGIAGAVPVAGAGAPPPMYAGFWLRFVAYLIDSVILGIPSGIVIVVVLAATGVMGSIHGGIPEEPQAIMALLGMTFILGVVTLVLVVTWLYFAGMESSSWQGTVGKRALGLYVTDLGGRAVSFGRASGRFFGKLISGLIPFAIGYIMAGFTAKKQALHDMIAGCLVLRRI